MNRNAFIGQLISDITSDFGSAKDSPLLAAFSSMSSDLDNEQLDELERMIEEKRAASRVGNAK